MVLIIRAITNTKWIALRLSRYRYGSWVVFYGNYRRETEGNSGSWRGLQESSRMCSDGKLDLEKENLNPAVLHIVSQYTGCFPSSQRKAQKEKTKEKNPTRSSSTLHLTMRWQCKWHATSTQKLWARMRDAAPTNYLGSVSAVFSVPRERTNYGRNLVMPSIEKKECVYSRSWNCSDIRKACWNVSYWPVLPNG